MGHIRDQSCVTIFTAVDTHCPSGGDWPRTTTRRDSSTSFWTEEAIFSVFVRHDNYLVSLFSKTTEWKHKNRARLNLRWRSPASSLPLVCTRHPASRSGLCQTYWQCPPPHDGEHLVTELSVGCAATPEGCQLQKVEIVKPAPSANKANTHINDKIHLLQLVLSAKGSLGSSFLF